MLRVEVPRPLAQLLPFPDFLRCGGHLDYMDQMMMWKPGTETIPDKGS